MNGVTILSIELLALKVQISSSFVKKGESSVELIVI